MLLESLAKTRPSSRRDNWREKLAEEKSSEVKKTEKEERAAREEHRQSAMERLGQTVKRHFEHFDHSHLLCLQRKFFVHRKPALNSRIFPPRTTSRPSFFSVQLVVVVVDAYDPYSCMWWECWHHQKRVTLEFPSSNLLIRFLGWQQCRANRHSSPKS